MLNKLKIYQIDPANNVISKKGKLTTKVKEQVDAFFSKHILKTISNSQTKTARFRTNTNLAFENATKAFLDEEGFIEASDSYSYELSKNIHGSVKDEFLLAFVEYYFEGDHSGIVDSGETIFAILKMDMNDGIQYTGDDFDIQPNMLPDLGNQLKKCSFVYKKRIDNFVDNNKETGFHLKVLDKTTPNVSNYFINLMSAAVVTNDAINSGLAKSFVKKNMKKYVNSEEDIENISNGLESIMSRRKKVNVPGIVEELSPFISEKKMENEGLTLDGLSDKIFEEMLQKNPSAQGTFIADPKGGKHFIISNKQKSVKVSIEIGLINDKIIEYDDSDEYFITLKIPKDLASIDQKR